MKFCHGKGNLETDGCCWVNGVICHNRWKIVDGRIKEGPNLTDLGTPAEFAATITNNNAARQRIVDQATGIVFACRAAINALIAQPALLNNRTGFEAAWAARPEYQPVADAWEALGKPRNWCPQYGPAEGQCCYSEEEVVNEVNRTTLSAAAVTIRQGRSG